MDADGSFQRPRAGWQLDLIHDCPLLLSRNCFVLEAVKFSSAEWRSSNINMAARDNQSPAVEFIALTLRRYGYVRMLEMKCIVGYLIIPNEAQIINQEFWAPHPACPHDFEHDFYYFRTKGKCRCVRTFAPLVKDWNPSCVWSE